MTITFLNQSSPSAPTFNGAAGSLITLLDFCLVTTMGWSKAFSGSNTASYRAPTGNRHYLGVDDSTTLDARVRGFETMTAAGVAVGSGTGAFPTDVQQSGGYYWYKSNDTSTARNWRFASDGTFFYLSLNYGGTSNAVLYAFGEALSHVTADAYATTVGGGAYTNDANTPQQCTSVPSGVSSYGNHHIARDYTQMVTSAQAAKLVAGFGGTSLGYGANGMSFPCAVDGKIYAQPVYLTESVGIRGRFPGLWSPQHTMAFSDGDTFTGSGDLAGRAFTIWSAANTSWQVMIETSDTWRT